MSSGTYVNEGDGMYSLSESDRHRLLASDRRRIGLEVLSEYRSPVGIEELATEIGKREADSGSVTEDAVERIAVDLHHVHLPLMAELGVVDYDLDSKHVLSG